MSCSNSSKTTSYFLFEFHTLHGSGVIWISLFVQTPLFSPLEDISHIMLQFSISGNVHLLLIYLKNNALTVTELLVVYCDYCHEWLGSTLGIGIYNLSQVPSRVTERLKTEDFRKWRDFNKMSKPIVGQKKLSFSYKNFLHFRIFLYFKD